jgi:hypothetical protein
MSKQVKPALPAILVAVALSALGAGGATVVAGVVVPDNSVSWSKLTKGVRHRINAARAQRPSVGEPGSWGERGEPGEAGERGPEGPSPYAPRCEIVEGDCTIYSAEFWRLQAAYEPFEIDTAVYPSPPSCLKAVAGGQGGVCTDAIVYLYPNGALGEAAWVLDPSAPAGWRLS